MTDERQVGLDLMNATKASVDAMLALAAERDLWRELALAWEELRLNERVPVLPVCNVQTLRDRIRSLKERLGDK